MTVTSSSRERPRRLAAFKPAKPAPTITTRLRGGSLTACSIAGATVACSVKSLDVGIVGCGTAGPAAALFLARQGHRVTLYERVAEPGPVGAGIVLQPSGMAVLAELGLLAPVLARGAPLDGLRCVNPSQRTIVGLRYRDLGEGWFGLGLHRGVLFETLFAAVRASSGITLKTGVSIESRDRPGRARAGGGLRRSQVAAARRLAAREEIAPYPGVRCGSWPTTPERRFHRELYQVVNGTRRLLGLLPTGLGIDGTTPKVSLFWSIRADRVDAFRSGDFAAWKAEVLAYAPDSRARARADPRPVGAPVLRLSRRGDAAVARRQHRLPRRLRARHEPAAGAGLQPRALRRSAAGRLTGGPSDARRCAGRLLARRAAHTSAGTSSPRAG